MEATATKEVNEHTKKSWADLSEGAKQNICGHYVRQEVQQCVSCLVSSVIGLAGQYREVDSALETDELQEGFCGYDYLEAAEQHINDCKYIDDLLEMAESVGDEDEAMLAAGYDVDNPPIEDQADPDDPESEDKPYESFDDFFYDRKRVAGEDGILKALRAYIIERLDNNPEDFCNEFDVDYYDYPREVYEYWLVSDWMGRYLKDRGYLVVDWMGLTVWGRQTTGQAILLDGVIRNICGELYDKGYYFPDYILERNNV
jgi:hypothetical protein